MEFMRNHTYIYCSQTILFSFEQWGTWKSGVSLVNTGIRHPNSVMKNVIPIVMAGGESFSDIQHH
jgi:hypothetical protein